MSDEENAPVRRRGRRRRRRVEDEDKKEKKKEVRQQSDDDDPSPSAQPKSGEALDSSCQIVFTFEGSCLLLCLLINNLNSTARYHSCFVCVQAGMLVQKLPVTFPPAHGESMCAAGTSLTPCIQSLPYHISCLHGYVIYVMILCTYAI